MVIQVPWYQKIGYVHDRFFLPYFFQDAHALYEAVAVRLRLIAPLPNRLASVYSRVTPHAPVLTRHVCLQTGATEQCLQTVQNTALTPDTTFRTAQDASQHRYVLQTQLQTVSTTGRTRD